MSILLAASSMGRPCHLFMFYDALASYLEQTWDDINLTSYLSDDSLQDLPDFLGKMERGFESANFPSLYEMLEKATRESGGVKIYACSTACKVLGLDTSQVRKRVDEVVGLTTMLQVTESLPHVLYI